MNVFINYDKKTLKVLGSYGEEENTPKPYIPVSIPDWNVAYPYGVDNLYVSDDLKTLVVDPAAKAKQDTDAANAIITSQISDIDNQLNALDLKSIRSRGEIMDGTDTDGKAAAQLAKYKSQIAELRAQRATLTASLKSV